jgi:hypothetical protein
VNDKVTEVSQMEQKDQTQRVFFEMSDGEIESAVGTLSSKVDSNHADTGVDVDKYVKFMRSGMESAKKDKQYCQFLHIKD